MAFALLLSVSDDDPITPSPINPTVVTPAPIDGKAPCVVLNENRT